MARKPSAIARELLRNFPKAGSRRRRRRSGGEPEAERERLEDVEAPEGPETVDADEDGSAGGPQGEEAQAEAAALEPGARELAAED